MLTDDERDAALAASPSPDRVTPDYMGGRIASVDFMRVGATGTLCVLTIDNGFAVRGFSACVDPANYNQELGEKIAYDDAFRQLWPFFGFLLAEKRFLNSKAT